MILSLALAFGTRCHHLCHMQVFELSQGLFKLFLSFLELFALVEELSERLTLLDPLDAANCLA